MKVICIDAKKRGNSCWDGEGVLQEGETYTVTAVWPPLRTVNGVESYSLLEFPHDLYVFQANRFAPISDKDETEMIREYNLTPEKLHAHQLSWYTKRLKEETRIEAKSFLRSELHRLKTKPHE